MIKFIEIIISEYCQSLPNLVRAVAHINIFSFTLCEFKKFFLNRYKCTSFSLFYAHFCSIFLTTLIWSEFCIYAHACEDDFRDENAKSRNLEAEKLMQKRKIEKSMSFLIFAFLLS